jgi:hypothetical protein
LKKSRKEIVDFILDLERSFPVDSWQVHEVDVWPSLRNALFGRLVNVYEYGFTKGSAQNQNNHTEKSFAKIELLFYYLSKRSRLRKAKQLFLSSSEYRETIAGLSRNKFYEYFLFKKEFQKRSVLLEYGVKPVSDPYSHADKIISFNKFYSGYRLYSKLSRKRKKFKQSESLPNYSDFTTHVLKHYPALEIQELINIDYQRFVFKSIRELAEFLKIHLSTDNLKQIFAVCYYNHHLTYAGMVCGKEMGAESIDVQHGPANKHHMCYSLWGGDRKAYNTLPSDFWLWDDITLDNLEWLSSDDRYAHKITGQPWMKFVQTLLTDLDISNYVLYTLQCDPHTIEELFSPQIIELIKSTGKPWIIRRHPRQQQSIKDIEAFIHSTYGEIKNLYVAEYISYSLPVLLSNCDLHFTFSSGSAIEASFFDKLSLVVGPVAPLYFKDYINKGSMVYIPHDSEDFANRALAYFKD